MLKKVVIVGGIHSPGELRRAIFSLLSYILPQEDIIPVRCASTKSEEGEVALFFGEEHDQNKSLVTLNPIRYFLGDDCHGWTNHGIFNMEWGCYLSASGLSQEKNPSTFSASRKFATILENVKMDARRRAIFEGSSENARISFPISHLEQVDRSGTAGHPGDIFIFIHDGMGVLPPLAKLTREQAVYYLLTGYGVENVAEQRTGHFPRLSFSPFFKNYLFVYSPASYAMLLWEKLERSQTDCWLVNSSHLGCYHDHPQLITPTVLYTLIEGVYQKQITPENLEFDPDWGFFRLAFYEKTGIELNPESAWSNRPLYDQWKQHLLSELARHFEPFVPQLDQPLIEARPQFDET